MTREPREPIAKTPAHDPGRPYFGGADWWRERFEAEPDWWARVFAEPFVRPGMACPHCGRASDTGDLHWPWCGRNNADG